jgi:hypothetical protein
VPRRLLQARKGSQQIPGADDQGVVAGRVRGLGRRQQVALRHRPRDLGDRAAHRREHARDDLRHV